MNWRENIKVATPLTLMAGCFFEFVIHRQSGIFLEYEAAFLSLQWILLTCVAVWCGTFIFLTFSLKDWPLIGLLLITIVFYFIGYTIHPSRDALTILAGLTLGKGVSFARKEDGRWKMEGGEGKQAILYPRSSILIFLTGLVGLLTFASWWHLDMSDSYYHGPRWMGLWDNPNTYGMLMAAGLLLAAGLRAGIQKEEFKMKKFIQVFLFIAIFMLGIGLVMSYSRGAWLGTAIGLLYLAWSYGKLKWRYVLPGAVIVALAALYFWGSTPDSAPWYVKRADLWRPSAQNRATAWRAGLEIMRDHPLGVGWNNAVKTYQEHYSPPEGGAAAITTNDYLMIGTELGIPALLCFVAYVGLCYRKSPRLNRPHLTPASPHEMVSPQQPSSGLRPPSPTPASEGHPCGSGKGEALRAACLAGALVFVVAFWFDGGLFKLPTAAMFWVLLELGAYRSPKVDSGQPANI